ncbi:glycosyltransferase [Pseudogulbenkiania subflava]|uniref:Glycosyl transferase family 2 n=1 Tax=Pseudogulbenkiania subflava DSM 22618 TaxID=1123014 RepID=A0A1Y6BCD5_9NEIS|nr:glycosyltransferase [Pseudogulbenkiania subflava]SMF00670.1 Glycosyl transferase family 2 [Pseudogulbenkiania subflava DSM 22618]
MISIVSVTYNNAIGLHQTLTSLVKSKCTPHEVIVIDGGSQDATFTVISEFSDLLPIKFYSSKDAGIYDAMNKGLSLVSGDLIHYLNAGDTIQGNIYSNVKGPCRLPVRLTDETGQDLGYATTGLGGYGYCHQGVIFPAKHEQYQLNYSIAADLDLLIRTFPDGVLNLPLIRGGEVIYDLCGVSAKRRWSRDKQIGEILFKQKKYVAFFLFSSAAGAKYLMSKSIRRKIRQLFSRK